MGGGNKDISDSMVGWIGLEDFAWLVGWIKDWGIALGGEVWLFCWEEVVAGE